jgi:peroxiredoxin
MRPLPVLADRPTPLTHKTGRVWIAVLLVASVLPWRDSARAEEASAGQTPQFTLDDLDGKRVRFADLRGEGPVLIDFWATWCKPCLRELPHIERLFQAYRSQGLQVIAIAEDETRSLPKVKSYIKTHGFTFPVLLDPNQRVLRDFRGTNCPYLVVISPTGEVVYLHSGYRDGDEKELAEVIARVIASHGQSAVGASDSKAGDPQPSGED